jgi:cytosine/adenosine deaminase-related metal-dependent hydrolase
VILWLFIPPFDSHLCLGHLQDLTDSELADMPSYNLAEIIHNKWLQQSNNRGTDLYIATVDDFVWALI